jgi:hypothetical protein
MMQQVVCQMNLYMSLCAPAGGMSIIMPIDLISAKRAPLLESLHVHNTLITTNTTSAAQLVNSSQNAVCN